MVLHPVMLIHGFNGSPQNWVEDGFVDFLVREGNFDPDLIHLFHYGYDEEGRYNNRGDITQIAHRLSRYPSHAACDLESQIVRLSEKSLAKGGPEKVDIVAHSIGGIVARYYLKQQKAGLWDAQYGLRVGKLIELGSPNLGLGILRLFNLIPRDSFLWKIIEWLEGIPFAPLKMASAVRILESGFQEMQAKAQEEFYGRIAASRELSPKERMERLSLLESPALNQVAEGSDFLAELNRPENTPTEVEYHCLYGDIRFAIVLRLWGLTAYRDEVSLGDLIVPVESASTIPGAEPGRYPFVYERQLRLDVERAVPLAEAQALEIADYLPPSYHGNLRRNPDIQERVLRILEA